MIPTNSYSVAACTPYSSFSILNNGLMVTVENKVKGGSYISCWELPLTEKEPNTVRPKSTKEVSNTHLSSFSMDSIGTELVIGTIDGVVKRFSITEFNEIDWTKENSLRVSHIAHLEERNDIILAITSDGRYSVMKLDGQQKYKQSNVLFSSGLFAEERGEEQTRCIFKNRCRKFDV
jgi:hypothetical protein